MKSSNTILLTILFLIHLTGISCVQAKDQKDVLPWSLREAKETSGAISYIFDSKPKPPLKLGKNSELLELKIINRILKSKKLPLLTKLVKDREKISGLRAHRGSYYWPDYPRGALTVTRTLTRDNYGAKEYDAIFKITIQQNKAQ